MTDIKKPSSQKHGAKYVIEVMLADIRADWPTEHRGYSKSTESVRLNLITQFTGAPVSDDVLRDSLSDLAEGRSTHHESSADFIASLEART
ncbi:MAG: hypothetical protein AAGA37_12960 [Actinomycetota bacterium]